MRSVKYVTAQEGNDTHERFATYKRFCLEVFSEAAVGHPGGHETDLSVPCAIEIINAIERYDVGMMELPP